MQIISNYRDWLKYQRICLKQQPVQVYIATYGMRLINESELQDLLIQYEQLPKGCRILVGIAGRPGIFDASLLYEYPTIQWRHSPTHHAKCIIFHYENPRHLTAIFGSRNFAPSPWNELCCVTSDVKATSTIRRCFNNWWQAADPLKPAPDLKPLAKKLLEDAVARHQASSFRDKLSPEQRARLDSLNPANKISKEDKEALENGAEVFHAMYVRALEAIGRAPATHHAAREFLKARAANLKQLKAEMNPPKEYF